MLLSRAWCYFKEWGIEQLWGLEVRKTKALMKWRQFHDRPQPRWLPEATSGFLKSSPSGPEFSLVYGGKIIQNGGRKCYTSVTKKWLEETRWVWNMETSHTDKENMLFFFCWIECQFQEKLEKEKEWRVNLNNIVLIFQYWEQHNKTATFHANVFINSE